MSAMSNKDKPDPLGAILDRLNGTVVKVTELRQSLDDLETELTEIRQLCENEIRTRIVTESSSTAVTVATAARIPSGPVSTSTSTSPVSGVSPSSLVSQGLGSQMLVLHSVKTVAVSHPPRPPTDIFPFPENVVLSSYPSELKREGKDWFVLSNPSSKVKSVLTVHLVHDMVHDHVHCVRFSPDGKWFAVGSLRAVHIYDVNTRVKICILDHGHGLICRTCFSPDGKYLATTTTDRHIRVWDISKKQIHCIFWGQQDLVNCLDFSPNGQFIISGSDDGSVHLWDVDGRPVKVLTIDDHYSLDEPQCVLSVAFSPDGRYVAVGSTDTAISMFEVTTGVLVQRLRGHRGGVPSVAFTPDGKGLISGSLDSTLKYWDVSGLDIGSDASAALSGPISSSPCLMNLTGHRYGVCSVAISHDGTLVVSTSHDGNILFWDMRTGVAQCMAAGYLGVGRFDLSLMGNLLAIAASLEEQIRIWSYGACS